MITPVGKRWQLGIRLRVRDFKVVDYARRASQ